MLGTAGASPLTDAQTKPANYPDLGLVNGYDNHYNMNPATILAHRQPVVLAYGVGHSGRCGLCSDYGI